MDIALKLVQPAQNVNQMSNVWKKLKYNIANQLYDTINICKSTSCDNQFTSIVSNEIKNGTKPNSMAYMDDDFSIEGV